MTSLASLDLTQVAPVNIRDALKLAEERRAYCTVVVEGRPELQLHVFDGRLLTTDETGRSIDLVQTIAAVLEDQSLCRLAPLCDVPDAGQQPTMPIAESLVAAVRVKAASATLNYDADKVDGDIVATTLRHQADTDEADGESEADAESEIDIESDVDSDLEPDVESETEPTATPESDGEVAAGAETEPAPAAAPAADDTASKRRAEADRMRAEFFQRRARRGSPGSMSFGSSSGPGPRTRPMPVPNARDTAATRERRTDDEPTEQAIVDQHDAADDSSRPTQRTALRSLIRNLMS